MDKLQIDLDLADHLQIRIGRDHKATKKEKIELLIGFLKKLPQRFQNASVSLSFDRDECHLHETFIEI